MLKLWLLSVQLQQCYLRKKIEISFPSLIFTGLGNEILELEENLDRSTSIQNGLDRAGKYESSSGSFFCALHVTVSLLGCL